MKDFTKNSKILDIPLEDVVIGKVQVRTSNTGKDIEDLAQSIGKIGLLEPIIVSVSNEQEGKYEIVVGQRRFLAHNLLKEKTIRSIVIDKALNEVEAKVLSLTENMLRNDMVPKDLIDVCTFLYKKYGAIKSVCEETGLPYHRVREYVKYDRLAEPLKELVDKGLDVKIATRAQDAASVSGELNEREAIKLAKELEGMSGAARKKVLSEREENPNKDLDKIIEDAKIGKDLTQMTITLSDKVHKGLQGYASAEEVHQDEAALNLIEDGLDSKGFLEEDE